MNERLYIIAAVMVVGALVLLGMCQSSSASLPLHLPTIKIVDTSKCPTATAVAMDAAVRLGGKPYIITNIGAVKFVRKLWIQARKTSYEMTFTHALIVEFQGAVGVAPIIGEGPDGVVCQNIIVPATVFKNTLDSMEPAE